MVYEVGEVLLFALQELGRKFIASNDLTERGYILDVEEKIIEAMRIEMKQEEVR